MVSNYTKDCLKIFLKNFFIGGIFIGILAVISLKYAQGEKLSAYIVWGIPFAMYYFMYLFYPNIEKTNNHLLHSNLSMIISFIFAFIVILLLKYVKKYVWAIIVSLVYLVIASFIYLKYLLKVNMS
jgi:hypothetical protein